MLRIYYTIFSVIFIGLYFLNDYFWQAPFLGLILGLSWLLIMSWLIGQTIVEKLTDELENNGVAWLIGLLTLIAWLSLFGAIVYRFFNLGQATIVVIVTLTTLVVGWQLKRRLSWPVLTRSAWLRLRPLSLILLAIFLGGWLTSLLILINSSFTDAARSPWEKIPSVFWLVFIPLSFVLLILIAKVKERSVAGLATSLYFFLFIGVALIVYRLGYGFDPFIHQATESMIWQQGAVTPKPFYYLGQYSLVVILSRLFSLSPILIDKLLLPLLTAVFLPGLIWLSLKKFFGWPEIKTSFITLIALTIPLTSLVVTTPQGLANFFLLTVIFLGLIYLRARRAKLVVWLGFLALTAFFIHPLAGLPAIIYCLVLWFNSWTQGQRRRGGLIILLILGSLSLPLAFAAQSILSPALNVSLSINESINEVWRGQLLYLANKFSLGRDLLYFYGLNISKFILVVAAVGLAVAVKQKKFAALVALAAGWVIVMSNYLIIKYFMGFTNLIDYEQQDYPRRLLTIAAFFLLPLYLFAWSLVYDRIKKLNYFFRLTGLVLIAVLISASLYFTYPRADDNYEVSHAYSTSALDFKTAWTIEKLAENKSYVVLANQSVSAAALTAFGFDRYYRGHYFYPLPTSGPLYAIYLNMIYQNPDKQTAQRAIDLTGVNKIFFVVNDYWWQSELVTDKAKREAIEWREVTDQGHKSWIFRY